MGPKSDAEDSDTDSRDILSRAIPPSEILSKPIHGSPVARLFCKNRFEYFVKKTRVLVGRSGGGDAKPEIDISIDSCSLYISRRHFDIIVKDSNKFFVSVYSKNGLFVDGLFLRKGSAECQLKDQSRLRFPKTDLRILFQLLEVDQPDDSGQIPSMVSGENGDFISENQVASQVQSYNSSHQNAMMKESLKIPESVTTAPAAQSKQDRDVYKQHHQPQSQVKKRKFRDPEIDAAANNHEWRGDFADGLKPPFSYSQLITQAIFSAPEHMLCLNDIYMFITKTYPFYKPEEKGWQNSIRHNLSLNKSFVRLPRANEEGKGSLWSIELADKQTLYKNAYRPRGTRDKYNHQPAPKIQRVPEPLVGESEESSEVTYQNEDEEAANNIAMVNQPPVENYNYVGNEHFGESEDQMVKAPQAAILQSSFANPMQIFMQPDRRGSLNQQHLNLSQVQRTNVTGAGSLQVVRLTVNPNNEINYGSFDASGQQESLELGNTVLETNQEPQPVWQTQPIRLPTQSQVPATGQRIFILRTPQQQQQQQVSSDSNLTVVPSTSIQHVQPKKIIMATSGGGLTFLNTGSAVNKDHGQLQRIVIASPHFQKTQVQENTGFSGLEDQGQIQLPAQEQQEASGVDENQALQFEALTPEQQQQVIFDQLLQQKQQSNGQQVVQILETSQPQGATEQIGSKQMDQAEQPSSGIEGSHSSKMSRVREIPIMEYTENS